MNQSIDQQRERNAETIRKMYAAERNKDIETWRALWHPEGRQTYVFGQYLQDVNGIDDLVASTAEKFATREGVIIEDEVFAMADPRYVFAKVGVGMTIDGFPLYSKIWCVFTFDADGLILECDEAMDTGYFMSLAQAAEQEK